jgi:hypothetical protein
MTYMVKRTILVETRTRELLKELEKKAKTYDQVINELIQIKRKIEVNVDDEVESLPSSKSSMSGQSSQDEPTCPDRGRKSRSRINRNLQWITIA